MEGNSAVILAYELAGPVFASPNLAMTAVESLTSPLLVSPMITEKILSSDTLGKDKSGLATEATSFNFFRDLRAHVVRIEGSNHMSSSHIYFSLYTVVLLSSIITFISLSFLPFRLPISLGWLLRSLALIRSGQRNS